ncbi:hypothetical protein A3F62_02175 [Candidatus Woesebacteria bacterium RIFCSPHIGHO2_12_FULL_44_11]|uniref:Uncharacterized protein n=1 Tax=Candidatus Woesebacteria bacterium RIFCSPLOWO2_01_FULL_44_14 TaxID=1802525 RepID=A0A1F8C545_9BACT|nr:MAG: hypothetical protein A3F62_02175 [Candidatus Woesebacteria bacterium RIFCSPHIGHO2_12_FULL_44_11]OGM70868.1 MAG: hypothetical protein A2975_01165 [Candidatus Woesebacteria bacterium RIFCSPLOWO2_01_FULL_44_14]
MMRQQITVLLILWGIFSTSIAIFFWNKAQKLNAVNKTLFQSNELHKELVKNEVASYEAINDCFVVNRGLCEPKDFKKKLETLGDEADELYSQIHSYDKQIQTLKVWK